MPFFRMRGRLIYSFTAMVTRPIHLFFAPALIGVKVSADNRKPEVGEQERSPAMMSRKAIELGKNQPVKKAPVKKSAVKKSGK